MAYVNVEEILEHLESDLQRALSDAVTETLPECGVDDGELFRAFKRAVGRRCSTWEPVPDRYVRAGSG